MSAEREALERIVRAVDGPEHPIATLLYFVTATAHSNSTVHAARELRDAVAAARKLLLESPTQQETDHA